MGVNILELKRAKTDGSRDKKPHPSISSQIQAFLLKRGKWAAKRAKKPKHQNTVFINGRDTAQERCFEYYWGDYKLGQGGHAIYMNVHMNLFPPPLQTYFHFFP